MISFSTLKSFIPPAFAPLIRKVWQGKRSQFCGDYSSWSSALDATGGYDAPAILAQVRSAALKVHRGEAIFEQDSVCFVHEEYRWPTLACLLRIAAENGGELQVLDFGGSLGSFYFQHRKHFSGLKHVRWAVVEQPHYAACGRTDFQDDVLRFYESVDECLAEGAVDMVLCSSVLQYLEKPYEMLAKLAHSGTPYILLDRTPFIAGCKDRLTVQHVPASIYPASYPAWFFSRQHFLHEVRKLGLLIDVEFPADDDVGIGEFKGMLLARL